jgi:hypothetical protein
MCDISSSTCGKNYQSCSGSAGMKELKWWSYRIPTSGSSRVKSGKKTIKSNGKI